MEDKLRALKQRYFETRALEDEAAWLRGRARSGEIDSTQVGFAAFLGYPAAILAVGVKKPSGSKGLDPTCPQQLMESPSPYLMADLSDYVSRWGESLANAGWEIASRALLGFALFHLGQLRNRPDGYQAGNVTAPPDFPGPSDDEVLGAHVAIGLRFADRLQPLLLAGKAAEPTAVAELQDSHIVLCDPRAGFNSAEFYLAASALNVALRVLHQRSSKAFLDWWQYCYLQSITCLATLDQVSRGRREPYAHEVAESLVTLFLKGRGIGPVGHELAAIRDELVPLILGFEDPIRTRTERSLAQARIASPCEIPTQATEQERVRFCRSCHQNVFDVSGLSREEAQALIRTNTGRFCVSLYQRADGDVQSEDCPSVFQPIEGRRLAMSNVMIGMIDTSQRDPFEHPFTDPFSDPDPYRYPPGDPLLADPFRSAHGFRPMTNLGPPPTDDEPRASF